MNDIRWKQRFDNFEKTLNHLESALNVKAPDILQKAGIVQFFEMCFELSWKLMKDYLQEQGFTELKSPREAIKTAFEAELINNGHDWMQMLQNRNLTTHTYDEETAEKLVETIKTTYYPLLTSLYQKLKPEL